MKSMALTTVVVLIFLLVFGFYYTSPISLPNENNISSEESSSKQVDVYAEALEKEIQETEIDTTLEQQAELNTRCYDFETHSECITLVDIVYLEDGREWKKIYKKESGEIFEIIVNYKDGDKNGHNFKFEEHEYWFYDTETLTQLSEQNDVKAQYILGIKLFSDIKNIDKNIEEIKKHSLRAAKNGYTASLLQISQSYLALNDKNNFFAYRLVWLENAPAELEKNAAGYEKLPENQKENIDRLVNQIKKFLSN